MFIGGGVKWGRDEGVRGRGEEGAWDLGCEEGVRIEV